MDLAKYWPYIAAVARQRLENNRTPRQVEDYGTQLELIGAAGELAARIFLGAPLEMSVHFDHGVDIYYNGLTIDVKATSLTPGLSHKFLQWPAGKIVKADIVILTAVNQAACHAAIVGYATKGEVKSAPVNHDRPRACMEIPIYALHPVWELIVKHYAGMKCQIVQSEALQAESPLPKWAELSPRRP
jgi:hypothetical protein